MEFNQFNLRSSRPILPGLQAIPFRLVKRKPIIPGIPQVRVDLLPLHIRNLLIPIPHSAISPLILSPYVKEKSPEILPASPKPTFQASPSKSPPCQKVDTPVPIQDSCASPKKLTFPKLEDATSPTKAKIRLPVIVKFGNQIASMTSSKPNFQASPSKSPPCQKPALPVAIQDSCASPKKLTLPKLPKSEDASSPTKAKIRLPVIVKFGNQIASITSGFEPIISQIPKVQIPSHEDVNTEVKSKQCHKRKRNEDIYLTERCHNWRKFLNGEERAQKRKKKKNSHH